MVAEPGQSVGGAGVGGELQEWGALLPLPSQKLVRPTTHAGSSPISCAIAAVVRGYPLLGAVVGEPALGLDPGDDLVHTGQFRVRGAGLPPAAAWCSASSPGSWRRAKTKWFPTTAG